MTNNHKPASFRLEGISGERDSRSRIEVTQTFQHYLKLKNNRFWRQRPKIKRMKFMQTTLIRFCTFQRELIRLGFKRITGGKHIKFKHSLIPGEAFPVSAKNGIASRESVMDARRFVARLLTIKS